MTDKWFGYDERNRRPYILSSELCERFDIKSAKLTDENLTTDFKNSYPVTIDKTQIHQQLSKVDSSGIHKITLELETTKGKSEKRSFCFFQKHSVENQKYKVNITVKNNADGEKRTKICIKSDTKLSVGLLYYKLKNCSVYFEFPQIKAKEPQFFLIEKPEFSPEFEIKIYKVPEDAEVYPENTKIMKYDIEIHCQYL